MTERLTDEELRPLQGEREKEGVMSERLTDHQLREIATAALSNETVADIAAHIVFQETFKPPIVAALCARVVELEADIPLKWQARQDEMQATIEGLEEGLQRIVQWGEAYPLDVFPEPDLKRARELLEAGGMTLDAVSASAMRRVVTGVSKIARAALKDAPQ